MRKLFIFFSLLLFSTVCFAQQNMPLKITGSIPDPNSTKVYQIQVGAFKIYSNAQRVFERLTNSSFNPMYEKYQDFTRVIIPGVNAKDISNYLERLKRMGFQEVFIKEDR